MGRFEESVSILNQYGTLKERSFAINVYVSVRGEGLSLEEACRKWGHNLAFYYELRYRMTAHMDAPRYTKVAKVALVAFVALVALANA